MQFVGSNSVKLLSRSFLTCRNVISRVGIQNMSQANMPGTFLKDFSELFMVCAEAINKNLYDVICRSIKGTGNCPG